MNLRQLKYFDSLSRTQHYQRSADELGVAQPSLSRAIAALEAELGVSLFEKQGRGVVLSRYGRVFAGHIAPAMRELESGVALMREFADPSRPAIGLAANYTLSNAYLPALVRRYLTLVGEDKVFFRFRQSNTPQILQDVKSGMSEVGFCSFLEDQPEIWFRPIVRREMCVLAPPGHPLCDQGAVSLRAVSAYPLIFSLDKTYFVENLFHRQGLVPQVACRMGEDHAIAGLVANGFGLSVVPKDEQLRACGVELLPVADPGAYRIFYLAVARSRPLTSAARAFCHFVLEESACTGALDAPEDAAPAPADAPNCN